MTVWNGEAATFAEHWAGWPDATFDAVTGFNSLQR
jgi:hypothetical protein